MFSGKSTHTSLHKDTVSSATYILVLDLTNGCRNYTSLPFSMTQLKFHGHHCAASSFFSPFVSTTGMGTGPPGESGNLAVRTSTPSAVTRRVCSAEF
jgi:hypothetical protein